MKIAIPTNDRVMIAKRTGRCKEFGIFTVENAQIVAEKYIENPHTHDHDHDDDDEDHDHSHSEIVDALSEVDILIVAQVGKFMKKDLLNGKLDFKTTKETELKKIIENL